MLVLLAMLMASRVFSVTMRYPPQSLRIMGVMRCPHDLRYPQMALRMSVEAMMRSLLGLIVLNKVAMVMNWYAMVAAATVLLLLRYVR